MRRLLVFGWMLALLSQSFAADSTVSSMTAATNGLDGTELYYCVQGSADRKCTGSQVGIVGAAHPGYISGDWYVPNNITSTSVANTNTGVANQIGCKYGSIPRPVTISTLGVNIQTIGTSNIQLALYANASGRPSTLLSSTASIVDTATGPVSGALGANQAVGPGTATGKDVWFCVNMNDNTVKFYGEVLMQYSGAAIYGDATLSIVIGGGGGSESGIECAGAACTGGSSTFNTWPATLAGSTWTSVAGATTGNYLPVIAFKPVSVP